MKIHTVAQPDSFSHLFFCPGCKCGHGFNVEPNKPNGRGGMVPVWTFNGDFEKPTVRPSILVRGTVPITDEQCDRIMAGEKIEPKPLVCHSFVTDGMIQFLGDNTHALAGQTVPLEEF